MSDTIRRWEEEVTEIERLRTTIAELMQGDWRTENIMGIARRVRDEPARRDETILVLADALEEIGRPEAAECRTFGGSDDVVERIIATCLPPPEAVLWLLEVAKAGRRKIAKQKQQIDELEEAGSDYWECQNC